MGCLCVTQQSFAQGCSPLPYILPPNRPAWPSCLHGNACVCVHVCSDVLTLSTLLSSGEAERLLPPPSTLAALFGVFLKDLSPITPSVYNTDLHRLCLHLSLSSILLLLWISQFHFLFISTSTHYLNKSHL